MKFRPCIDIHNGKVKQIVGSSITDSKDNVTENYISEYDSRYYAAMYKRDGLKGGHIILLNARGSEQYDATLNQALMALNEYPGGLQLGGGVNEKNAEFFLEKGASHVIVTSYVFSDGKINYKNIETISKITGKDKLVLDLSCRKKEDSYYIVTDRWTKFTEEIVDYTLLDKLSVYCDEFLIHAVDVEGKVSGIEKFLVKYLGQWNKIPITYAGGISSFEDINELKNLGNDKLDYTVGSALDIFGGRLPYKELVKNE
jgi:phosphoribosylformimino-5-aminoimidazole carboxamide ribotide isomerase